MDGHYLEIEFPKLTRKQKTAAAAILRCKVKELYGWSVDESDGSESDELHEAGIPHLAKGGQSDNAGPYARVSDGTELLWNEMDHDGVRLMIAVDNDLGQPTLRDLLHVSKMFELMKKLRLKL